MARKIIGNVEYSSIENKSYINGAENDIYRLAEELEKRGISYSGRINSYRATITVDESDRTAADRIMSEITKIDINVENGEKKNSSTEKFDIDVENQPPEIPASERLIAITNEIAAKEKETIDLVTEGKYDDAERTIAELKNLKKSKNSLKAEVQKEDITQSDVQALRDIQPPRKSVQNMLESEVAGTPKFEKLLGEEMGKKSPFEMRNSDNAWRNDESKTVPVIEVQKRPIPEKLTEIRKRNDIPRGIFENYDTGIEIMFSRRSVEETITNAMHDDKRNNPVEARVAALYQMKDIIENAVCFDSQLSEPSSSRKSDNTLFIHRMYGVFMYDNEQYLYNMAVEETYATDKNERFRDTSNRLYNFDDIKITPVKLLGGQAHASPQNADTDTSTDVIKISIPQLYNLVKTYDTNFFENPEAAGRTKREAEIKRGEELAKSMDALSKWQENEKNPKIDIDVENENMAKEAVTSQKMPTITCDFSESPVFEDNKTYSVYEFDRLMKQADDERVAGKKAAVARYGSEYAWLYSVSAKDDEFSDFHGYDKVQFTVNLPNGTSITERQDVGDGHGGVIDYLEKLKKSNYKDIAAELRKAAEAEKNSKIDIDVENDEVSFSEIENAIIEAATEYVENSAVVLAAYTNSNNQNYQLEIHKAVNYFFTETLAEVLKYNDFLSDRGIAGNDFTAFYNVLLGDEKVKAEVYEIVAEKAASTFSSHEKDLSSEKNDIDVGNERTLEVGDLIKYEGEIWRISDIQGDFSLSLENTDKNSILPVRSIIGHWKENLERDGFEYIGKGTDTGKEQPVEEIMLDNADKMPENEAEKIDIDVENTNDAPREKSFSEQVDDVLSGKASRYNDLKVCDTPQILLDVGLEQLPMLYTQKHLRDALKPKGDKGEAIHHHGLEVDQIKSIPNLLSNPVMIYDSLSRNDSIVVVTSETDSDKDPIIVAIKPNGSGKYNLEVMPSNFITSIHGRSNFANQIEQAVNQDKLLFWDKQKSQELLSVLRLQLSEGLNNLDSDTIIHQSHNIVKGFDEKILPKTEKNSKIDIDVENEKTSEEEPVKLKSIVIDLTAPAEQEKPAAKITLTDKTNSFSIVTEVRAALVDLQNGAADNYDWKNFHDGFVKVMEANVHSDIGLPLYKSCAEKIFDKTQKGKKIAENDLASAISNLDLVVKNSYLLKNPAPEFEQISFFGEPVNRVSMDEVSPFEISANNQSETAENAEISVEIKAEEQPENSEKKDIPADNSEKINYTISDEKYGSEGGAKTRFANNVAAIRLLKTIEDEGRKATADEQKILAKYVGWGGIPQAFDSTKKDWSREYNELINLLTPDEYAAARSSTLNAHYTSPVVINAIYSALENMGFKGGEILEPAAGIGNFFGAMPEEIRNNSHLHGVELDSITGRIAQQLYQSADIQIKGYEKTNFKNDRFDVAVGNVPFGDYPISDTDYKNNNFFIHDYFFAKSIDKIRPGGIIAFVTSQGTLDKENPKVRKYLAERAEFLGAVRLPNNAFKANAGTEVTTDIIFLQKRERAVSIENNTPDWVFKSMLPNGIAVNKYFADNPHMILGEMVEGNKLYGNQTNATQCVPIEGADLKEQLAVAIKNISGEYRAAEKKAEKELSEIPCPPNCPKYSFVVQDGNVYFHKADDTMTKSDAKSGGISRIKAMVEIRDKVHKLLELQLDNSDGSLSAKVTAERASLNEIYDKFRAEYGLLNSAANKKLFEEDKSYRLLTSLEKLDKDGNFVGKADIFVKNTISPNVIIDHCDNANDALIISISEKARVDLPYMSRLTGKSEDDLIAELSDKIFQNPQNNMRWESADEYLTGNVRAKLKYAEEAGLTRNAEALKAVIPEPVSAADISVKLGSAWIDPKYVRQFIIETLKPDFWVSKEIEVTYSEATDKWKVDKWQKGYSNALATETYGTEYMNAYQIIEATLNMKKAEVRERKLDEKGNYIVDSKGRYVLEVNQEKTMVVQAKQDEIKRKFQDWIFADPERRETLVNLYNEKFNAVRLREYDGSHLNFVGMNSEIRLKEHQKNAVARDLYSGGNTLLAHEVGAGKTFEMIAIAMEGKRLGLHHKPMFAVPNALTEQWGDSFRTLYPGANILVATEKDFKKENRRDLFAKIATGDWDAVIIGHSQFDMIHLSKEREVNELNQEIAKLEVALSEMIEENGKRSYSVKQVEKTIASYNAKIEKTLAKTPEDDMLPFEMLGVDKLFVDESQNYKNLDTPTKMHNVAGLGSGGSGKSMQLLMKCRYLDEITGGRGTVFASGTPISNSMSEMYTLMRYLQANKLRELGINSFDQWASIFGETTTSMELSPEGNGKYQMKTRFAKFQNLPELMNIFKECADIKTADTLNLDRPDFEMHNVNVPATKIQASMIKDLGERAKKIRSGAVAPTEDNMCKLTVDGRKIGLDQRCMNAGLPDDPNSKVNVCVRNVYDIWEKTAEQKCTQLIFSDLATPQPPLNENRFEVYHKREDGQYEKIYSAKLADKDTPDKLLKRLNEKPPKDFTYGQLSDGDIILTRTVNYKEETAYNSAFEVSGKKTVNADDKLEQLRHSPTEQFETERKFCVYDDIKQKLISMGVPTEEIAFIHDYDKAEDKQKLFDRMNKGEVRVLIGSTSKCGAGMNAQERMIALHDLDAPMRPSDMQQRHGRIIRQGNTNKKVDIYRYTTDKTFDAYLYQMLENKQKFISQIMTDKTPVRSCEDVDEVALDYAEVKALCAGSPLIKEKIDLETEITKLNVLKSNFLSQKYSVQDKAYKTLPELKKHTENEIERLKNDIEAAEKIKPLENEDGKLYYPVTVGDKVYRDKEEAGQAIRQAILNSGEITEGKEKIIGSYRGFEMSAFIDTLNHKFRVDLKGAGHHYGEINMNSDVNASGNIVRLDNIINSMEIELQKHEERLQAIISDIEEAAKAAEAEFPQEQELAEKEKRLAEVNAILSSDKIQIDETETTDEIPETEVPETEAPEKKISGDSAR